MLSGSIPLAFRNRKLGAWSVTCNLCLGLFRFSAVPGLSISCIALLPIDPLLLTSINVRPYPIAVFPPYLFLIL